MIHRKFLSALVAASSLCGIAGAQEIVTDPQTGRTYRQTRTITQRPVSETHIEHRPYTVYTEKLHTEYHPTSRTVLTPVTEYHWEPYLANRWNPFAQPTVQYRYVPRTRWESRVEQSHVPISRRELVPEQRVAQVPVVHQRFEQVEHITRVPVSPGAATTMASNKPIGGVSLEGDPPRQGNWQPPASGSVLTRR